MANQKTTAEVATKIRVDLKLEKLNKAKKAYDFAVKFFNEGDTSKLREKKSCYPNNENAGSGAPLCYCRWASLDDLLIPLK
jgi:hypothetical protein